MLNPEKRSGTYDRTNRADYDIEAEILCNEDNQLDYENRCVEPKLFGLQRAQLYQQLETLLGRYDYEAILSLKGFPDLLLPLVQHLALRKAGQATPGSIALAKEIGIDLFPVKTASTDRLEQYRTYTEHYLMLRIMQRTGQLTDFAIYLNPILMFLEQAYIEQIIQFPLHGLCYRHKRGFNMIDSTKLAMAYPTLSKALDDWFGDFHDSTPSLAFCSVLITWWHGAHPDVMPDYGGFFRRSAEFNDKRNAAAHNFGHVTEEDIMQDMGMSSGEMIETLENLIALIYPELCDRSLFGIYDRCNRYLLKNF